LPVLAIGGHAVHIPFHTMGSEKIDHKIEHMASGLMKKIIEVLTVKITGMSLLLKCQIHFFLLLGDI
jgi:hypothetical protein